MIVPESVKKDWDVVSEPSLIQIDKLKKELQSTKEELQSTKEELQSEKNKVATMELLVASLVKRVGDLENLVI
jgi:chromosome segregation ATPase